ncbi:signal peptidase I [Helicobacter colisuis]|uniref:signal peptidase I n=1 Tax=Helicobacter colisuis TaxID=2949739 RepID=UPI002029BDBD|nr:signal peptidase I [Helicobacter colisuis]MCL9823405.1 signal peptidase I [Helicobacter colisuis]
MQNKILRTLKKPLHKKGIDLKFIAYILAFCLSALVLILVLMEAFKKYYSLAFFRTNSITNVTWVILERDIKKYSSLKNKIVSFDFPIDTQYFKKDTPFAKEVKCESGDTLNTQGKEYFCNSIPIGKARTTDSNGNPVKQFIFNGVIPENYYFVMGDNPKSFDSRYWGFLEKENIRGVSIWKY